MTGDQLTVSRLLATTKQYSRIRIAVFSLWDCSILLFGLQYSLMRTKKIPHLSHFLWKRLYIKGKEHGRDVFDLSHISPVIPPIDSLVIISGYLIFFVQNGRCS